MISYNVKVRGWHRLNAKSKLEGQEKIQTDQDYIMCLHQKTMFRVFPTSRMCTV